MYDCLMSTYMSSTQANFGASSAIDWQPGKAPTFFYRAELKINEFHGVRKFSVSSMKVATKFLVAGVCLATENAISTAHNFAGKIP